jgi:hypothetical protein
MRKKTFFIFLVLFFTFSFISISILPGTGFACSCAEPPAVEDEFEQSTAVFTGKVREIKEQKHLGGRMTKKVLFDVTKTWKGVSESQVIIATGFGGGDCGYEFQNDEEYLVYASPSTIYGDKDDLTTIICDRTNEVSAAQDDLIILGEGKVPTETVNLENEWNGISPYAWILAIIVIVAVAFFIWKRFKK